MGFDGVLGLPGYSGLVPNTMLGNSLVTVRDLLLAGEPSLALKSPDKSSVRAWVVPNDPSGQDLPTAQTISTLRRLQPSARQALVEMELLEGLRFEPGSGRSVVMKCAADPVFTLTAPSREQFARQLALVQSFGDLRLERMNEILSQVVPQTAYWASLTGMGPDSHRYTWELLGCGLRFAMMVVMRFKHMLECPRPGEYSALIQPVILTPGYATFPSGHATEGHFAAIVIADLVQAAADGVPRKQGLSMWVRGSASAPPLKPADRLDGLRAQLRRLAYRVAENRVVAGLHFPIDSVAGHWLGAALASFFTARASGRPARMKLAFPVDSKADLGAMQPTLDDLAPETGGTELAVPRAASLSQLWDLAKDEWR